MNNSVYRISLDIHTVGSQVSLPIKRGDTARTICVTLTENGKPYQITDGCYAKYCEKNLTVILYITTVLLKITQ